MKHVATSTPDWTSAGLDVVAGCEAKDGSIAVMYEECVEFDAGELEKAVAQTVAMSAKQYSDARRAELWGIGAPNVAETPQSHPAESKAVAGEKE